MRRIIASAIVSLFLLPAISSAAVISPTSMVPGRRIAAPGKASRAIKMAGYIGIVKGSAKVLLDGVEPWVKAKVGQKLTPGTQIQTRADSQVTIAFTDGSKVRIGQNAKFTLETVKRSKISVYIGLGRLEAWVKKLSGRTFQARNPVSVASVRGTVFTTTVDGPTSAITDLFSGGLAVTDNYGRTRSMSGGQRLAANAETGSTPPAKLPASVKAPAEPPVNIPQIVSASAPTTPLAETGDDKGDKSGDDPEGGDPDSESGSEGDKTSISQPNPTQDTATVSGSTP